MQVANRIENIKEYYFSHKLREVREMVDKGYPVINLGIGNPDIAPPNHVVKALTESILNENKHGYQPYKGIPELRKAIAEFYDKYYQIKVNGNTEILPLTGAKEGVMHISMAFLNPGDKVLIPNPGYATYSSVTKLVGATPLYYNLNEQSNWFPDFKALEKQDLNQVKIMWVNYPNMPTGAKPTTELYTKLVTFAKKHNILIVNDNPYSFILNNNPLSILSIEGAKDVAIELNSLSKSFNIAGWRIGIALGNDSHIQAILKVKSNMDSGMFYSLQKGAVAALQTDDNWFTELNNTYSKRREIVWKIADKLGFTYQKDTAGMFVWAKISNNQKSEEITDILLKEKHIFVTPGSIFGSNGEGYMRFSLCQPQNVLEEVLKRLEK